MSHLVSASPNVMLANSQPADPVPVQKINVCELTLLLKLMGFRLNYLDYEENDKTAASPELTVTIRCGRQNIVSRLSACAELCSCPVQTEMGHHDRSFWEILGTAPPLGPNHANKVEDASSNLLPDLSKRGASDARKLLALIFEVFRKDHLPITSTAKTSPERVAADILRPSTTAKSPQSFVPYLEVNGPEFGLASPARPAVPPNTPKVPATHGERTPLHARDRERAVYVEMVGAKERLEKALFMLSLRMDGDQGRYRPSIDPWQSEELEARPGTSKNFPETLQRRSSLCSLNSAKIKAELLGVKAKSGLARNKSEVDTAAANKARAAVTSRYMQPRKPGTTGNPVQPSNKSVGFKKVSSLARSPSATSTTRTNAVAKRAPMTGLGSWK